MNTDNTAASYADRGVRELGQQAHDGHRSLIWAWDNPALYPIEKQKEKGERSRQIYMRQRVHACLWTVAKAMSLKTGEIWTVEDVADALLCRQLQHLAPKAWALHDRHEAESRALLEEMSRNGTDKETTMHERHEFP